MNRSLRASAWLPLLAAFGLAVFTPLPALAQDAELERPDGWQVRFDRDGMSEDDLEMFVAMPPGWHITTGPAGIFWDPAWRAEGDYRIELDVFLFDPAGRREAFGIFFGGQNLDEMTQRYGYFLIREGGEFILKERNGVDAPTLEPWTTHPAIASFADRAEGDASVLNELAVEARGDRLHFFVNDTEVGTVDRSRVPTAGTVGVRVNHGLNLHISRFEVMPLGQ